MVAAQNILKLAELSLNLQAYLDRIKLSGNPTVVSIEHQPQAGILSMEHDQQLTPDADLAKSLKAIDQSLKKYHMAKPCQLHDVFDERPENFD